MGPAELNSPYQPFETYSTLPSQLIKLKSPSAPFPMHFTQCNPHYLSNTDQSTTLNSLNPIHPLNLNHPTQLTQPTSTYTPHIPNPAHQTHSPISHIQVIHPTQLTQPNSPNPTHPSQLTKLHSTNPTNPAQPTEPNLPKST